MILGAKQAAIQVSAGEAKMRQNPNTNITNRAWCLLGADGIFRVHKGSACDKGHWGEDTLKNCFANKAF